MQLIHSFKSQDTMRVNFDVRVLLCCPAGANGVIGQRLASLGTQVEVIEELFTALAEAIDDPNGYGVFILNCDTPEIDGLDGGSRAVKMLSEVQGRLPVILISKDCVEQRFPEDRLAPTELRAPLSALSLRVGMEHALRERLAYMAA